MSRKHLANCASLCTNFNERDDRLTLGENRGPCLELHNCWCPQGGMTYAEYQAWRKALRRQRWANWSEASGYSRLRPRQRTV